VRDLIEKKFLRPLDRFQSQPTLCVAARAGRGQASSGGSGMRRRIDWAVRVAASQEDAAVAQIETHDALSEKKSAEISTGTLPSIAI
jgi:hypothetical protein